MAVLNSGVAGMQSYEKGSFVYRIPEQFIKTRHNSEEI